MSNKGLFRLLCFGDVVGRPGRQAIRRRLGTLRAELCANLVIANGENAAGGVGIDPAAVRELHESGVDVVTLGDHTWQKREMRTYLDKKETACIRPANYPSHAPGVGWHIWKASDNVSVGIMNLLGRVFLNTPLDCPFRTADALLCGPLSECQIVICDIHAEATSEKAALGRYLDGRASVVFGTHTHVPTADEQILPKGTAYITDVGMCGSLDGVIGMASEVALERFLSGLPRAYEVAEGQGVLCGIYAEIDMATHRAITIRRVREM